MSQVRVSVTASDELLSFEANGTRMATLQEAVRAADAPLDIDAFAPRALAFAPRTAGETPYRGVRAIVRWPTAETAGDIRAPRDIGEAATLLRVELEGAVDRALENKRRVAVMTGGGLDSGGLLAITVRRARERGVSVFALALDFASEGDDRPHLLALEQALGCEVLRVRPEEGKDRLALLDGIDAMPFVWPSSILEVEAYARARANGAEVVLSGGGGDELFDGDPYDLSEVVLRGDITEAVRSARRMKGFHRPRLAAVQWPFRRLVTARVPISVRRWRARRRPPNLPDWAGPRLLRWARETATVRSHGQGPTSLELHRVQLLTLRHLVVTASGMQRRDPFLDARFRAALGTIPPHFHLTGDVRRGLFRRALGDLLPPMLRDRLDKAVVEPALERMIRAAGGLGRLRRFATGEALADYGLVESKGFQRAFDAFAADPTSDAGWTWVWPALASEAFLKARR